MTKTFSLTAILSATTGRLLCAFSDMHELAEFVEGHPIWAHEFASPDLTARLRDTLIAQHPDLAPVREEATAITAENYKELLAGWEARFGKERHVSGSVYDEKGYADAADAMIQNLPNAVGDKPTMIVSGG